jgi:hypothetical protein
VIITQAMLAEFDAGRSLLKGQEELRGRIVHLLEAGAVVEPGKFSAELRTNEQRRLTKATLAEVLGAVKVDEIMTRLPATSITTLRVEAQ